jgi:UDP-N-acetylmuramyl pentapeptide phosphotransferase/UDP-N-acetylglucosamine-1-phosphate transferase
MIIDFYKLILLFLISCLVYFLKIRFMKYTHHKIYTHQKYSSDFLGNPIGGYVIFFFIILFKLYSDYLELFFLFAIFFLGILSDIKIFNSPIRRLFFQIFIILTSISISEIGIASTRIDFIDHLLMNKIINVLFTTFCILIVINGSNFIDGLNGLVTGYYLIIITLLLNYELNLDLYFQSNLLINFAIVLIILLLVNILNKVFLGDNGSYLIGFLFSIYLIKVHQVNSSVSPYFIILLLWYPCFENLFSIIRKKITKVFATNPDNSHLHQLFFQFFLKKYNIKNKLAANNLTSLIINTYHFLIFYVGIQNINLTNVQLYLLGINITMYICLYIFLYRSNKNLNKQLFSKK